MVSSIRSVRFPRPAKVVPVEVKSSSRPPTPMPSVSRPAEMDATDAASLAISTASRVGSRRMLVSNSIRSVTAAAAASEISESWFGNATRSMVASVVKPRCSAAAAHVGIRVPGKWGTGLGRPIPIFMNANVTVPTRPRPDGETLAPQGIASDL
jgi:hypothetical protein